MTENSKGIDKAKNRNKDIELRSEKVRNIIGKIPPRILRVGISVVSLTIIGVLILAYLIPYPQYSIISVQFYSNPLVQTVEALNSGIFYSDIERLTIYKDEEVGLIKNINDSVFKLYSKVSGEIFLNSKNGDYIEKNKILFTIIPDTIQSAYAIGFVMPEEIKDITVGQFVYISLSEKSISGKIVEIYPIQEMNTNSGSKGFKIKIGFSTDIVYQDKNLLFPNTTYTGKILTSKKPILQKIFNPK
ncbi:hypothetical protein GGR21_000620 [Dysgonomonas hofstadii]|uniref:HlyD family secretion protein n=1 Tax=Dysgonomonas hofstadii TaxID=637886 RepID=A0A840CSL9_9BACT|nr:HlyD family secretion protein [Dysgonomonas hofstadii]MBB4034733.1 hypothetical protein [Dysgonomonas hofstadii]